MTDAQALATLLTVESFLLAVMSLTATLTAPGRSRVSALPIGGVPLAFGLAGTIGFLAVGAVMCWGGMYVGGAWRPPREGFIAVALLVAVVAQPVVAVLMALGVRTR